MNLSEDELHALAIHGVQDELSCYICSNFKSMWHGSSYWTELYAFLYSERGELTQNRKKTQRREWEIFPFNVYTRKMKIDLKTYFMFNADEQNSGGAREKTTVKFMTIEYMAQTSRHYSIWRVENCVLLLADNKFTRISFRHWYTLKVSQAWAEFALSWVKLRFIDYTTKFSFRVELENFMILIELKGMRMRMRQEKVGTLLGQAR